jgi:hypothetical protein
MIENNIAFNMCHFIIAHLLRYLTLLIFTDTWPTYSFTHRNSKYHRVGEKQHSFVQRRRTFLNANNITPHFIRPEAETWQTVFLFGVGKGGGENRINSKGNRLNSPQNLLHRAVQTIRQQVRRFVRNTIVWGDMSDVKLNGRTWVIN